MAIAVGMGIPYTSFTFIGIMNNVIMYKASVFCRLHMHGLVGEAASLLHRFCPY